MLPQTSEVRLVRVTRSAHTSAILATISKRYISAARPSWLTAYLSTLLNAKRRHPLFLFTERPLF